MELKQGYRTRAMRRPRSKLSTMVPDGDVHAVPAGGFEALCGVLVPERSEPWRGGRGMFDRCPACVAVEREERPSGGARVSEA